MTGQRGLDALLSAPRAAKYYAAADHDQDRALDLYLWSTELSGALHAQLSFVELAVRNAMDTQLAVWNAAQPGGSSEWATENAAQGILYTLMKTELKVARKNAHKDGSLRPKDHPRHGAPVNHDDVIAQLMFGAWVKLLRPFDMNASDALQHQLWIQSLHHAFPGATPDVDGRRRLGNDLNALRFLRNRVAHHDNVLSVNINARLRQMLSVMSRIDPTFPAIAMARSSVRRLLRDDPRRRWGTPQMPGTP